MASPSRSTEEATPRSQRPRSTPLAAPHVSPTMNRCAMCRTPAGGGAPSAARPALVPARRIAAAIGGGGLVDLPRKPIRWRARSSSELQAGATSTNRNSAALAPDRRTPAPSRAHRRRAAGGATPHGNAAASSRPTAGSALRSRRRCWRPFSCRYRSLQSRREGAAGLRANTTVCSIVTAPAPSPLLAAREPPAAAALNAAVDRSPRKRRAAARPARSRRPSNPTDPARARRRDRDVGPRTSLHGCGSGALLRDHNGAAGDIVASFALRNIAQRHLPHLRLARACCSSTTRATLYRRAR